MDWLENLAAPIDGDQIMDGAIDARDEGVLVLAILSHPRSVRLSEPALDHCRRMLDVDPDEDDWRKLLDIASFVRGGAVV